MKLRNKKTGEIADLSEGFIRDTYNGEMIQIKPVAISNKEGYVYDSLAELNKEWEDYEEPKGIIDICLNTGFSGFWRAQIDYDNREEAERAVEKLKAWKRLKDKGFEFGSIKYNLDEESSSAIAYDGIITIKGIAYEDFVEDLDLLFGGEE